MINVAFPLLGRGGWTGGYIYLKNTLMLIKSRLPQDLSAHVFLSPEENKKYGNELRPLVDGRVIVTPETGVSGRGNSLFKALIIGKDGALEKILKQSQIDVAFENAGFYGWRFGIPIVSWIPDLQHRHMPEMFSRANWWRRDFGFNVQAAARRTIMISSYTAQHDLERFYPLAKRHSHVVRFAADVDLTKAISIIDEVRAAHQLPERYFFLPNQFWRHKNHKTIIDALALLKRRNQLADIPPIVLTGQPSDPRAPAHFDTLIRQVKECGVESHFRYLGLLPYGHVMALNAACERMINPSFFEGWSTPIEEAKAFATPMILSDIAIHREQAPDSMFFKPGEPEDAARVLYQVAQVRPNSRPSISERQAAQAQRLKEHASSLRATVRAACGY